MKQSDSSGTKHNTTKVVTKVQPDGTKVVTTEQRVRVWMQVVVSLVMLATGLLVLFSPNPVVPHGFDESAKKFAAGWIGLVLGYWLS